MVMPSFIEADQSIQNQVLGPHIDSPGGFGNKQDIGVHGQGPGNANLLLVAAAQAFDHLGRPGTADIQFFDHLQGMFRICLPLIWEKGPSGT
jgi:hypothetical protein